MGQIQGREALAKEDAVETSKRSTGEGGRVETSKWKRVHRPQVNVSALRKSVRRGIQAHYDGQCTRCKRMHKTSLMALTDRAHGSPCHGESEVLTGTLRQNDH
jgi:hypothetical protein